MDKLLEKLIAPVSISGRETEIARLIADLAKPYGEISTDHLGNLVVYKKGMGKRILLAAHMDTVGLIVTYIDDDGFARFGNVGGLRLPSLIGQRVKFDNGVIGVVCAERGVEPKDLKIDKLYVDTLGQKVQVGDTAAFFGSPEFNADSVMAHSLDDRIGCAILLKTMELLKQTENEIFFVFTVQEEVGARGARPVAYTICPDLAIAVDVCGTSDTPGDGKPNNLTIDGGPVINYMDSSLICHPKVVKLLEDAAQKLDIRTQRLVSKRGGTDAGGMYSTRGGVPSGVLSIPIRYLHTHNEVANMKVAADCARILAEAAAE